MNFTNIDKPAEMRFRRLALSKGYRLEKSRERTHHSNNKGGFQIIRIDGNEVVEGVDFDIMSADDLEYYITALPVCE